MTLTFPEPRDYAGAPMTPVEQAALAYQRLEPAWPAISTSPAAATVPFPVASTKSLDLNAEASSSKLRRRGAVRTRSVKKGSTLVRPRTRPTGPRACPPSRKSTVLPLASAQDVRRLSAQSISSMICPSSACSFGSNQSSTSLASAASTPMPRTPPPIICDLPIQTISKSPPRPVHVPPIRITSINLMAACTSSPASPLSTSPASGMLRQQSPLASSPLSAYSQESLSISPVSTYSSLASPLDGPYDLERSRVMRAKMAEKIAARLRRRRSTGETIKSASTVSSEAWLWDRHCRMHEWEREEATLLAAVRKAQAEAVQERAYEEWKREYEGLSA